MTTFSSEARTSASPLSHDTLRVADEPFGWADGEEVRRYTLTNSHGMRVRLLNYGGIVQTIEVPDREGRPRNVILGFRTLDDYRRYNPAPNQVNPQGANVYFGALIGRYANPIGDGIFTLDGTTVRIPKNMEWHAMHGGTVGFDQKVWRATLASTAETVGIRLAYTSPAGEMGFPGTLEVTATYSLDEDNRLTLSFEAVTDATTVLNLTNHIYWNLAGEGSGSIYDHLLQIEADGYNPVTPHEVPTGTIAPVAGTPFDFTRPVAIGERIRTADDQLLIGHGYDHNYALRQPEPHALRTSGARDGGVVGPGARGAHDPARAAALHWQRPAGNAGGHRRRHLSPGRCPRPGGAALPGCPQPSKFRLGPARPGRRLPRDGQFPALGGGLNPSVS